MVKGQLGDLNVDLAVDTSYCESFPDFGKILQKPKLNKAMFKCEQSDWHQQFQAWAVVYVFAVIMVSIIAFALRAYLHLQHNKVIAPIADLVFTAVHLVTMVLFVHCGWFLVVKKKGCCGKFGYLVWAVVLVLASLGPLYREDVSDLVYLIMLVPVFYMSFACIKLFNKGSGQFHLPQLLVTSD
jgi:hypothetical protein